MTRAGPGRIPRTQALWWARRDRGAVVVELQITCVVARVDAAAAARVRHEHVPVLVDVERAAGISGQLQLHRADTKLTSTAATPQTTETLMLADSRAVPGDFHSQSAML